jgi:hypothetical protein
LEEIEHDNNNRVIFRFRLCRIQKSEKKEKQEVAQPANKKDVYRLLIRKRVREEASNDDITSKRRRKRRRKSHHHHLSLNQFQALEYYLLYNNYFQQRAIQNL